MHFLPSTFYLVPSPFHRLPSIFYLLPPTYPTFDLQPSTFNRRPVCLPYILYLYSFTFHLLPSTTFYLVPISQLPLLPSTLPRTTWYLVLPSSFYLLPTFTFFLPSSTYLLRSTPTLSPYLLPFCLLPSAFYTSYRAVYLPLPTCLLIYLQLAFYLPATFYPFYRLPPSTFHLFDLSSTCLLHLPLTTYLLFYLLPSAFYLLPSAFHLHLRPFAFLFTFYLPALLSSTYVLASSTVYRFCLPCRLPLPLPYLPIYPVSHVLSSTFYQAPSTSTL